MMEIKKKTKDVEWDITLSCSFFLLWHTVDFVDCCLWRIQLHDTSSLLWYNVSALPLDIFFNCWTEVFDALWRKNGRVKNCYQECPITCSLCWYLVHDTKFKTPNIRIKWVGALPLTMAAVVICILLNSFNNTNIVYSNVLFCDAIIVILVRHSVIKRKL